MGFFAVVRLTFREVNSSLDAHKKATVNVPSVQNAIVKKKTLLHNAQCGIPFPFL